MILLNGSAGEGPTVAVIAGIHGAEYAGIDTVLALARDIDPTRLRGRLILVPCVNVPAFFGRGIYVNPLDGKNLNRVFPGSTAGTASEVLAATLVSHVIGACDYFVDLHGGDMVEALIPFMIYARTGDSSLDAKSVEMARVFGLDLLVEGASKGNTLDVATRMGKPSILAEAGGQGILDAESAGLLYRGCRRVLAHLGLTDDPKPEATQAPLRKFIWMRSEHRALFYPLVAVGQEIEAGQKVGEMRDLFGNTVAELVSPDTGPVLFLATSLASSPGEPLLAVGAMA
ncbi:MAG: M14 family metallopeptidase [Bacillota bacterium]